MSSNFRSCYSKLLSVLTFNQRDMRKLNLPRMMNKSFEIFLTQRALGSGLKWCNQTKPQSTTSLEA